ncbi:phage tail tube protein [Curtobacterium sp. MCSS17_007]|uniref:phage tail tube protein n=1 Tax=Curtobacterium sp. MCSS17_007 TaxID=2175646 RepID=UPI000DAA6D00|nr:phage tail tube protein [Curtobacterium sp. MCSS17_007]WIE74483.1 phage tail tube protein [Curtobacterium sp. MCSS17_007]
MSSHQQFDGRIEAVGLGLETTPGVPVAPQIFYRWLDNDLQPNLNIIENNSAMGNPVKVNDSEIVARSYAGTLGGKVTDIGIGYLFYLLFGSVSSVANGGLFNHTFDVLPSSVPKTATLSMVSPAHSKRHPYAVVDSIELKAEAGGWVTVSAPMKARLGSVVTTSAAFVPETEFTSKHVSIKFAANQAGIAAAPVIDATSVTLNLDRSTGDPFFPLGTDSNAEFDRGPWEAKGEITMRYKNTDFEDGWFANSIQSAQITIANGTKTLVLSGNRVRIREISLNKGLDDIVTQTVSLYFEPDTTGKTVVPVLTNAQVSYLPA